MRFLRRCHRANVAVFRFAVTMFLVSYLAAPAAYAAPYVWTGTSTGGDGFTWSDPLNWTPSGVPGTTDTVTFDNTAAAASAVDLGAGVTIGSIAFDNAAVTAFTIGSGAVNNQTLTLDNSGSVTMSAVVAADQLFNASLVLGDAQTATYTLDNDSAANSLTIAGNIAGGTGGTAGAKTLAVTGDGTTVLSGIISDGGATSLGLTKSGTGTLTLSGNNGFTGGVTVSTGKLRVGHDSALGTGTFSINGGTVTSTGVTARTLANNVTVGGDFTVGDITDTGDITFGGTFDLGGATRILTVANNTTLGGIVQNGGLTKAGTGALTLSGANTFGGGVILSAGTLNINNASALGTGAFAINGGTIDNTTAGALTVANGLTTGGNFAFTGSQNLTLSGANNLGTAVRTITVNGGSLVLSGGAWGVGGGITKAGTGTLTLSGANAFTGNVTVSGGTLVASGSAAALGAGALTLQAGSTLLLSNATALSFGRNTTVSGNSTITTDRTLSGAGVTHTLGSTTAGTLSIGAFTLTVNAGPGATSGTQGVTVGNTTQTGSSIFTVNNNGLGAATLLTINGTLGGNFAKTFTGDGNITVAGAVSGSGGLVHSGSGVLTLSGTNTFTTTAQIGAGGGTVRIGHQSSLGAVANALTINGGTLASTGSGAIVITNYASTTLAGDLTLGQSSGGTGALTLSGPVTLTGNRTITVSNAVNTISGIISGVGFGLAKAGPGNLVLSAANTFGGPLTINAGMVSLNNATALPGGIGVAGGTAGLTLNGGVVGLQNGNFLRDLGIGVDQVQFGASGGGFAAIGAARNVNLGNASATVTWDSGSFVPNGAPLILSHAAADNTVTFQNPIDLNSGTRTVHVDNGTAATDATISAAISGTGGLTKTGAGTLSLTAANTFSGDLTVSGGTLQLQGVNTYGGATIITSGILQSLANDVLPNGSSVTVAAGTLNLNNFNDTIGSLTLGGVTGTPAVSTGTGTLTLGGDVTYDATGSPSAGTISGLLALGGADRIFNVGNSTPAADLTVSAIISGANGITKSGAGTMVLTTNNTFTGGVIITGGMLQINTNTALPGGVDLAVGGGESALTLDGGVLGLQSAGDFTRALGVGVGQVQFGAGGGGFAAIGAARNVNLGGVTNAAGAVVPATVTWDSGSFVPNGAPLILGNVGADNTLTFQNPINLNGAVRTIQVDNGSAGTDAILSYVASGAGGGLTKTGAGNLRLDAANTYDGVTAVNGGMLSLNHILALPGALDVAVGAGESALALNGGIIGLQNGDFLRSLGTGPGQIQFTGSGGFAAAGALRNVNLGGAGATVTWDSGSFIPNGSILILSTNAFDNTVVFINPIDLNGAVRTIQVDNGSAGTDAVLTGGLTGVGTSGVIKTGAGTLALTGASTLGSGGFTLAEGVLLISNATAVGTSGLTIGTVAAPTLASASSNAYTISGPVTVATNFTLGQAAGGTGALTLSGNVDLGLATRTITVANPTNTLSGDISGAAGVGLTKAGAGTLILSGNNTYTGPTTISAGTLQAGSSTALPSAGNVLLNAGVLNLNNFNASIGTLTLGGAAGTAVLQTGTGTLTLGGDVTFSTTGTPSPSLVSGNLDLGAANRTFAVNDSSSAGADVTVSAVISGTGVGLIKEGTGTLLLSGANTYTGPTVVNTGVLYLNSANAIPGGIGVSGGTSALSISGGQVALGSDNFLRTLGTGFTQVQITGGVSGTSGFFAQAADRTVDFGGTATWGTANFNPLTLSLANVAANRTLTLASGIDLNGATRTVQVDDGLAVVDAEISGVISGALASSALTKTGAGRLVLSGNNSFIGVTTVSAGALRVQNIGALGTVAGNTTVSSGAALELAGGLTFTLAEPLSINGTGILLGGALRNVSGNNTYVGTITLAGTTRINSDAGTLTLDVASGNAITGTQTLSFGGSGDIIVADPIATSTGTVTKDGSGALTLAGLNTSTGTYTVNQGTLNLDHTVLASRIADTAALALGGGTVNLQNAAGAYSEVVVSTIVAPGASRVTASGSSTLRMNAIARTNAGGTVDFGAASIADTDTLNTAGILGGYATVGTTDWAINSLGAVDAPITALASYDVTGTFPAAANVDMIVNGAPAAFTINSLRLNTPTATTLALTGVNTISSGGILVTPNVGLNNVTFSGGTSLAAANANYGADLIIHQNNSLGTLTISTPIANAPNPTARTGTTALSTTITGLSSTADLAVGMPISGTGIPANATVASIVSGTSITISAAATIAGTPTLTFTSANGLTKSGAGTLVLSGANTYTGQTFLNGGTLSISANANLGAPATGAAINIRGGTLQATGSTAFALDNAAAAFRAVTLAGAGGTFDSQITTGTGLTISGLISGTGDLIKTGQGVLTLSTNINTYTGRTVLRQGTLNLDYTLNNARVPDASQVVLEGGNLNLIGGSTTDTVASTAVNGGANSLTRSSGSSVLRMNQLTRSLGGTLNIGTASIADTDSPAFNGILGGWVTVNNDWATITAAGYSNGIPVFGADNQAIIALPGAAYTTVNDATTWTAANNVNVTNNPAAALNNTTINSLKLGNTISNTTFTINSGQTLTVASGGLLDAAGTAQATITGGTIQGAAGQDLIVHQNSLGALTISSVIADNTSATALTKSGIGPLMLGGANTFTGPIYLNQGVLSVSAGNNLGAGSSLIFGGSTAGSSVLQITGGSAFSSSQGIALNADGTVQALNTAGQTLSGVISGVGSLTKSGAQTLTLTGANTFLGNTIVNAGILSLDGASPNGSLTSPSIVINSGGTLRLNNTAAANSSGRLNDTAAITLNGGTLNFNHTAGAANYAETAGTLTVSSGASTVTSSQAAAAQTSTLTLASLTRLPGATLNFTGTGLGVGTGAIASQNRVVFTTAPTLDDGIIGGWATVGNEFAKYMADVDTATGGNQPSVTALIATDYTAVTADSASWVSAANIKVGAGSPTLGASRTINSLNIQNTTARTLGLAGFTLTIDSGGLLANGQNHTISGAGLLTAGPNGAGLYELVPTVDATRTLTISSVIGNNGANPVSLVKAGAGTLVLSGVNTYTGKTYINSGIVSIAAESGLGAIPGAVTPGNVTLNTGTLTYTGSGALSLSANRGFDLGSGGGTISIGAGDLTIPGVISGPGGLTKAGASFLTLSGVNTFTGPVTVSAGRLFVTSDANLGTAPSIPTPSSITLNGGMLSNNVSMTLNANRGITLGASGGTIGLGGTSQTFTYNGIIDGAGNLTKSGAGSSVLTLGGNNTFSGTLTLGNGILNLNGANANIGAVTVANGSTLNAGNSLALGTSSTVTLQDDNSLLELANGINIPKSLVISDTGANKVLRLTVAGVAEYSGAITVNEGTAQNFDITSSNTAGLFIISGAISGTANAGITKEGAGIVALTGDNTFTSGTYVNAGTLVVTGPSGDIAQSFAVTIANAGVSLQLNNATNDLAVVDRIGNANRVILNNSGTLVLNGTSAAGTTLEDIGELNIGRTGNAGSLNQTVTLNPSAGNDAELRADSLNRTYGTALLLRGANLGTAAGANTSRIKFDTAPAMIGGGGTAGSTTISIIPFASADTSVTGLGGSSFVTHDSTLGVRLLNVATEYDMTLTGSATRNVNLTGNTTLAADQTINALRIAGGDLTINAGQTLTDTSGAILFTTGNSINGPGSVAFGNAEAVIHGLGGAVINPQLNANLTGSGGLTVNLLAGNALTLGGNNTFTGQVTINSGFVRLGSATALGQGGVQYPNAVRVGGGALDLRGQSITVGRLDAAGGVIENTSSTPVTLTINNAEGNSTLNSALNDAGHGTISLVKTGLNTLLLQATTANRGTVTVEQGMLNLDGNNARFTGASAFTLRNGSTLQMTYNNANNGANDRLPNGAPITMEGATLNFNGISQTTINYSETVGVVTLNSGGSTIYGGRNGSGQTGRMTLTGAGAGQGFVRNTGATLNFAGPNLGDTADASRNQILFSAGTYAQANLVNGIIGGWATLNGLDWASYLDDADVAAGTTPSVTPYTAYTSNPLESGFTTGLNIELTGATGTITLAANRVVNSLNFAPATASTLDLGGNTLRIESGGILASGAFASTIQNGTLTAGTGAGGELILHSYTAPGVPLTAGSVIADDGANVVSLIKAGTGDVVLTGNNTFTGQAILNAGTLRLGHANAISTASSVRLNGGTLASDGATARTIASPVTLAGDVTLGEATTGTGALTLGAMTVNDAVRRLTVNNPGSSVNEISGVISGTGGIAKSGPGTLKLTADNTYLGHTIVNQGILLIDNGGATANRTPLGVTGQLRLGGGTVTVAGGGVGSYLDDVNSSAVIAGHSRITTNGTPTFVLGLNTLSAGTGGTLDFAADNIATVDTLNNSAGILGGWATVNGADWARNSTGAADGAVAALPGGSYINGASVLPHLWTGANNLAFAADPSTVTNNATAGTLKFTAPSALNIAAAGRLTLDSGGILVTSGSGEVAIGGGTLRGGSPQQQLAIHQYNTSQPLIISSLIADNGSPTALVKSGPGELIIHNPNNTFTGTKFFNGGTVTINPVATESTTNSIPGPLGATPGTAVVDLVFNGGTLTYGPLTIGGQVILSDNRLIRLDANGGTLISPTVSGVPRVMQLDATIMGIGSLTFAGDGGFLPNDGGSTYSGGTTISGNAIVMPNVSSGLGVGPFGTGPVTMTGGKLTAWAGTAVTLANQLIILGDVTIGYSGPTGASQSTQNLTLSGPVDLGGGTRVITVDSNRTTTVSGAVYNGMLTKTGTGTLTLQGVNNFAGPITVNQGTLIADSTSNPTVLNPAASLVLGGGTLQFRGVGSTVRSQTLNGLTVNSGASVVELNNTNGTSTTLDLRGLALTAGITRNAGGTVDFRSTHSLLGAGVTAFIKTAQANVNGILGGWATADGGAGFAKNDGSGNIIAAVAADYTDVTRLASPGPKVITSAAASNVRIIEGTGAAANITLAAAGTTDINTLMQSVSGGTGAAIVDPGTTDVIRLGLNGAILSVPTAGALTIGAVLDDGFLTAGGAPNTASDLILNNSSGNTMTINSVIQDNGSGAISLVKAGTGAGVVLLNSAGTYTGNTIVGAGTLRLGAADRIPNGSGFGNVTVDGILDLNNFSETINGLNGTGVINNVAGTTARTLTIGDNNADGTFTGRIINATGSTALTKIGTGTQTIAGQTNNSSYSGPTWIQNGAIRVDGNFDRLPTNNFLALGSGVNSGKLILARDQALTDLTTSGTGTANAVVGGTNAISTLSLHQTTNATFSGMLGGVGTYENNLGLAKFGAGNLTLNVAHTATGPVTINAGTITLNGANGSLAASGTTILPGGSLVLDNTANYKMNRLGGGSLTLVGGGIVTTFSVLTDSVNAGSYSETLGTLTILGTSGTVTINTTPAVTGSTSTLTFAGLSKASGVTLDFSGIGLGDPIGDPGNTMQENRIYITGMPEGPIPGATVGTDDAAYSTTWGVYALLNYETSYTPNSHPGGGSLDGTPTGWTGSGVKANPGGGVRLTAGGGTVTIGRLKLDYDPSAGPTPGYNSVDLNGGTLVLFNGILASEGSANQSIIDPLGTGKLTVGTGLAPATLAVTVASGNQLSISAKIANNGAQTTSLTKAGAGTLVLSGVNTFTGTTVINGGTVSIAADSGLGVVAGGFAASQLTINGGTLLLGNGVTLDTDRGVTLGASHGTVQVDGSDSATIPSIIAGASRTLTKTGTGTLTLSAINSFSGGLNVNAGTVRVTGANATVLGAATTALNLNGGNLAIASDTALSLTRLTTVSAPATITVDMATAIAGNTKTLGTTFTFTGATPSPLVVQGGNTTASGTIGLTFSGATVLSASSPQTITVNNGTSSTTLLTLGSTVNNNGQLLTIDGTGNTTVTGVISGLGGLSKGGAGTLTLNGANTFTGGITVNGGTLLAGVANALGATANPNDLTLGATGTVRLNGFANTVKSLNGVAGAIVENGHASTATTLTVTTTTTDSYAGILQNGGAATLALTKTGTGTLTLGGANTYTGATTVNNGVLRYGINSAIAGASAVTVNNTAGTSAILDLNGFNGTVASLTLGGTGGLATSVNQVTIGTGTLTLGGNVTTTATGNPTTSMLISGVGGGFLALGANRTFTVADSTGAVDDLVVSSIISGATFGVTKAGAGTLVLSGANTYSGATVVNAGTLRIASTGSINGGSVTIGIDTGTATMTVDAGGSLSVGTGAADTLGVGIKTTAGTASATGTLDMSAASTFTANVGTVRVGVDTVGSAGSAVGTLKLAAANTITASTSFVVGDNNFGGNGTSVSSVEFGQGANNITTPLMTIGGRKAYGSGTIRAGGTLTLNNGVGRTALNVGVNDTGTGSTPVSSLDLTGGTLIADLSTLKIGSKTAGTTGASTGSMTLGISALNDVDVNSVIIGELSGATAAGLTSGTLTFNGGTMLVNNDVTLGSYSGTFGTVSGTFSINNGSVTVGGNVIGSSSASSTSTLSLVGGTLDMTDGNITDVKNFNFTGGILKDIGTVNSPIALGASGSRTLQQDSANPGTISGVISGGAGITKTGTGTVTFSGANTYTGDTTVSAGTLALAGGSAIHDNGKIIMANAAGANLQLNANETIGALTGGGAAGGNVNLQGNTLTVGGGTSEFYNGQITGTGGLALANSGTTLNLVPAVAGGNTFTGTTTIGNDTSLLVDVDGLAGTTQIDINGGSLILTGSGNRINNSAAIHLNAGVSTSAINTMGMSEQVGTLTLNANSVIDMASGSSTLTFANSSGEAWTGTLSIFNWTGDNYIIDPTGTGNTDMIFFGVGGLTSGQQAQISFYSDSGSTFLGPGILLGSGQVVPVPEPSTWVAIFAVMGFLGWRERRRLMVIVRRVMVRG